MVIVHARHRAEGLGARPSARLTGAVRAVDDDAAADGVGVRWARAVLWAPLAGAVVLLAVYVGDKWGFFWVLREDHPVEWFQFTFLVIASLTAVVAAVRFARQGRWGLAVLLLLVAVTAFGMAGEEISWGQRVFGWRTPGALAKDNRQGETNLHNIDLGVPIAADTISDYLELLMGLGGVALALLARPARSLLRGTVVRQLAPPLFAVPGFAFMALYQAVMNATGNTTAPGILYQEWMEFCFYGAIAITVVCVHRRAAAPTPPGTPSGGGARRLDRWVPAGLAPVVWISAFALVLTLVFAVLSTWSGIMPGNVPGAMQS